MIIVRESKYENLNLTIDINNYYYINKFCLIEKRIEHMQYK